MSKEKVTEPSVGPSIWEVLAQVIKIDMNEAEIDKIVAMATKKSARSPCLMLQKGFNPAVLKQDLMKKYGPKAKNDSK